MVDEKIDRLPQIYDYPEPVEEDDDPIAEAYKRMQFTHPTEWLNEPEKEDSWVVDGLMPEGALTMVVSFPKGGKSTFTRHMAVAIAKGEDFLGRSVKQGKVLYLALEENPKQVKRSFRRLGLTDDDPLLIMFGKPSKEAVTDLRAIAEQEKPVIIFIDTVTRMPKASFEMNDYMANSAWLDPYMYLAHELGIAVDINYHSSRSGRSLEGADAIASPIGSTGILATPDQIINIKVESDHTRSMSSVGRYEPVPSTILGFDRDSEMLTVLGEKSEINNQRMRESIMDLLNSKEGEWIIQREGLESISGKAKDKNKAINELVEENLVERQGEGRKNSPYEVRVKMLFPIPSIDTEQGTERFTPIKMERLEFDI